MDTRGASNCPDNMLRLLKVERPALLFFASVVKINDHYQAQKRYIAVTADHFYNIKQGFFLGYSIKRTINIDCIQGLIRNPNTQEFLLKVSSTIPNDYRYVGECWEALTQVLLKLRPRLSVWTITTGLDNLVKRKRDTVAKRENGTLRFERSSGGKTEESGFSTSSISIADSTLY